MSTMISALEEVDFCLLLSLIRLFLLSVAGVYLVVLLTVYLVLTCILENLLPGVLQHVYLHAGYFFVLVLFMILS